MSYEEKIKELVSEDFIEDARWIDDNSFIVIVKDVKINGNITALSISFGN